jgi:hypothetical protein
MYLGGYFLLIVLGALLRWAVTYHATGFDIQTAGLIIMIVGIVGLAIAILFWFDGRGYAPPWRRVHHVDGRTAYEERVVHEHIVRDRPPGRAAREPPPPDARHERVIRDYVPPPHDQENEGNPNDASEEDTWARTGRRPGDQTRPGNRTRP